MRRKGRKPRKPRPNPRVRVRCETETKPVTWKLWHSSGPDGPWFNAASYAYTQVRKYDWINSYVGARSIWNPVSHRRIRGNGGSWTECTCVVPPEFPHLTPECPEGLPVIPVSPDDLLAMRPTLKPSTLSRIQSRALVKATVQMPTGTSIANFLIELREGVHGILPRMRRFKDLLGNLYLGYKFGVESFLRDLNGLYKTWGAFQRRLSWLRKHNGACDTWIRESRKEFADYEYDVPADVVKPYSIHDELGVYPHLAVKFRVVPESVSFRVHCNVLTYFLLRGLDTFLGKLDAFSAAFGLNNPAKIAWNAKAMSWLVEYFVNVGPYLDKLGGQPFHGGYDLPGNMELRAFWTSVKVVYQVEVYEMRLSGEPGGPTEDYVFPNPSGTYVVRCYDRYPGVDLSEEELVSCQLTDQQKTILLALGESRTNWDRTPWTKWAVRKWGPWSGGSRPRLRFRIPPKQFRDRFLPRRNSSR